jgi:hypothetical protein
MLDKAKSNLVLRGNEWDIAAALRELSIKRRELPQGEPGPITRPLYDARVSGLGVVEEAVTKRVEALEDYAAKVKSADDAYEDYQTALKLADETDEYIDFILYNTATDKNAIDDIADLARQAVISRKALLEALTQANDAAELLTALIQRDSLAS